MSNGLLDNMAVTPRMWWLDVACSNHLMLAVELYENLPSARQKVRATHSSTHPWPAHVHALTDAFTHRGFYTQKILHTEAFTRRGFYTQKLLHAEAFTHRRFYTQKLLHRRFLQRRFYTQKLLHTDAFTHRSFYTEHTEAFKQTLLHRRFYTDAFTHKSFYTQTLLHTDAFTHRRFYTETLLHTDAFTQRRFYITEAFTHRCFYTQKLWHTAHRSFVHTEKIAILPQFLASFRAKGLQREPGNRNFTSGFDDRTSFRAKGLRGTTWTRTFYLSFLRSNLISCERVARDKLQIAILPQFLTIEPRFMRKGCAGQVEIAILPQFLTIEPRFVRKGCAGQVEIAILPHFWRSNLVSCERVAFRAVSLALPLPPPSEEK